MKKNIETELMKLIEKAKIKDEVPVAAIIVKKNKIIAKAYNRKRKTNNPMMHAEIKCVLKATKKLNDWRLNDCEMYVTLEPCNMCKEIINEARISKVYYYCSKNKALCVSSTKYEHLENEFTKEIQEKLKLFFKNKRK